MKAAYWITLLLGFAAWSGCQSPNDSLERNAQRQADPVRIEFVRHARVYEPGDALFSMVNETRRVLWFDGTSVEAPIYRLKSANQSIAPAPGAAVDRMPLSPGERHYFDVKRSGNQNAVAVGITFYPSRSATSGTEVWSAPVTIPAK